MSEFNPMQTDIKCKDDDNCSYLYFCNDNKLCEHDGLWPPSFLEILAFILLPILIGVGNVGGLGGGITKVPIMMILLNYTQRVATFQAYCIQFGACLSNAFLLFNQRHPNKNRPLIDYNIGFILVPVVMLGTTIGIYANAFAPEIVCNGIFIVFLIAIMPFLYKKSQKLKNDEKAAKQQKLLDKAERLLSNEEEDLQDETDGLQQDQNNNIDIKENVKKNNIDKYVPPSINQRESNDLCTGDLQTTDGQKISNDDNEGIQQPVNESKETNEKNVEILKIYREEAQIFPYFKFFLITSSFLISQLINFIIGTKTIPSIFGFDRCGAGFWIFTALLPIAICALSFAAWLILSKEEKIKQENGYEYDKEDLPFNFVNFRKIWLAGFLAGFLAGALGAGGGLSLVTFLMALGLNSRVASATTGMNNLFIGLTSMLSVVLNEVIPLSQILVFTIASLVGGLVFSKIIYYFVQKYNKTSLVVLFVLVLCIINILSNIGYIVKTQQEQGWNPLLETKPFC